MTNYLVILENRADLSEDLTSFLIQAANIEDAHNQMEDYKSRPDHEVIIQSVNSIWLNNDIRKSSRPH